MIYRAKGVAPEAARALVDNIMRRSDVALDTLAREELGLDPNKLGSPWVAAVSSFLAFALGAAIPLIPFLVGSGTAATIAAAVVSVLALFAAGAATSIFTGRHAGRAGCGWRSSERSSPPSPSSSARPSAPRCRRVSPRCPRRGRGSRSPRRGTGCPRRGAHVPVAGDRRVGLLHAVVGHEDERGVVEHAGALDRVEDLADARVGVADRRLGDLRVRAAGVEGGVGEREVAPHEAAAADTTTPRYSPLQMPTACSTPMWSTTLDHE